MELWQEMIRNSVSTVDHLVQKFNIEKTIKKMYCLKNELYFKQFNNLNIQLLDFLSKNYFKLI